jgi:mannose-1-phosphate guanylyltransferase/mannose-6-phosphate isomerase
MSVYVLILAGGSGTRLWPLSREEMPKQFLAVCGSEYTLLQQTVRRMLKLTSIDCLRIIASEKWRPLVTHQLSCMGIEGSCIVDEPGARNTAPAIALGVASLINGGADDGDIVLVCPSDHVIADEVMFGEAVNAASESAAAGNIVTFGIKPTTPETGFGYIKTSGTSGRWLLVDSFVEKPDLDTAKNYMESGDYYWNGGIFCFSIGSIVRAYGDYFPEGAHIFGAEPEDMKKWFLSSPVESIDYAVMEKARNITCIPLDAGWSDVGSWDAVYDNSPLDERRSAAVGNVSLHGGGNSLVIGGERLVCGIDLDSMIVVDTPDALFVAPRGASQKLKGIVDELARSHREEIVEAPISARPWGTYRVLSKGERHKIKRIIVSPGGRLSLQYHMHRSEHWVVVKGTAKIVVYGHGEDDAAREQLVHEGESAFVPKGYLHRLDNPGRIPLEIIEVQIGEYVGEDDIVRVKDEYMRN